MRRRNAVLTAVSLAALCSLALARAQAQEGVALPKGIPSDLWELLVPPENAVTPAKVALGRRLYFDKRLSRDGTVSCATCHDPEKGFADGKATPSASAAKRGPGQPHRPERGLQRDAIPGMAASRASKSRPSSLS